MNTNKFAFLAICGGFLLTMAADSAPSPRGGGRGAPAAAPAGGAPVASARSATTRGGGAPTATAAAPSAEPVASARSATTRGGGAPTATAAAPAGGAPVVSARSGVKQTTIQKNVTVNQAVQASGIYDEECKTMLFGCFDQFCFAGNENGARCNCSNDKDPIDKLADEIASLEKQAINISTTGVETVALGAKANVIFGDGQIQYDKDGNIIDTAKVARDEATGKTAAKKEKRKLTFGSDDLDDLDDGGFDEMFDSSVAGAGKKGQALFRSAYDSCKGKVPQNCQKDMQMLMQVYNASIASDCKGYSIEMESRKKQMLAKVEEAKKMVRDAHIEAYEEQNKYNRGECMLEFRKCMADKDRGGCGTDFSGCAGAAGQAKLTLDEKNKVAQKSRTMTNASVPDENITITFAASTMEVLESKRFVCERVLDQCMSVRQFVWGDFLREVAPTMRQAELNSESNLRQNCLKNVTDCVHNACQSDMAGTGADMNMCLGNPDMAKSFCKVQIDQCQIVQGEGLWEAVKSRLAAMRVDACTDEVKSCFKNENRCGDTYTACIGLDLAALKQMCPLDALPVCTKNSTIKSWDDGISQIVQGIFLNVDNSMLTECQNLVDNKMNEICGETHECLAFTSDDDIGASQLHGNKAPNGNWLITGLIQFGLIDIKLDSNQNANRVEDRDRNANWYVIDTSTYMGKLCGVNDVNGNCTDIAGVNATEIKGVIEAELKNIQGRANKVMDMIATDPKISMCINGRDMSQITGGSQTEARFPNLLQSTSAQVMNAAILKASQNHAKKVAEETAKALKEANADAKNSLCIDMIEKLIRSKENQNQLGAREQGKLDGVKLSSIAVEISALKSESGKSVRPMSPEYKIDTSGITKVDEKGIMTQIVGAAGVGGAVTALALTAASPAGWVMAGIGLVGALASNIFGGATSIDINGTIQSSFDKETLTCTVKKNIKTCKTTKGGWFTKTKQDCKDDNTTTPIKM
ncbi:MAG: hypothetical protein LBB23_00770 [Rickettsiales bacterium]|jgi:hypothetical protein|nr:hypothetical protein [Rickettsiales bacterium]